MTTQYEQRKTGEIRDLEGKIHHSKLAAFKANNHLQIYDVFQWGGAGAGKARHGARAKLIGLNVLTLGLINIKFRLAQDRRRLGKKKGDVNQGEPTTTHEAKLASFVTNLGNACKNPADGYGYPGFGDDLKRHLCHKFGLSYTPAPADSQFEQYFAGLHEFNAAVIWMEKIEALVGGK